MGPGHCPGPGGCIHAPHYLGPIRSLTGLPAAGPCLGSPATLQGPALLHAPQPCTQGPGDARYNTARGHWCCPWAARRGAAHPGAAPAAIAWGQACCSYCSPWTHRGMAQSWGAGPSHGPPLWVNKRLRILYIVCILGSIFFLLLEGGEDDGGALFIVEGGDKGFCVEGRRGREGWAL